MAPLADHEKPRVSETANVDKDEFGRDIRPESPKLAEADSLTVYPVDLKNTESLGDTQTSPPKMPVQIQLSTGPAATQPIKTHESDPNPYLSGLDKFDVGTFDFRAAASWEALGKLWQISHGYLPSQEELMQFVIARGAAATGPVTSPSMTDQTWPRSDWSDAPGGGAWRGGRGWGRHPRGGRGGFGHGYQKWGHMNMGYETNTSDAIVLGGGSEDYLEDVPVAEDVACTPDEPKVETTSGGAGGKMQRVGDKWVFVRDS
jgi:protein NRD1